MFLMLTGMVTGLAYIPTYGNSSQVDEHSKWSKTEESESNNNVTGYTDDEIRRNVVNKALEQKEIGYVLNNLDIDMCYATQTGKRVKVQAKNPDGSLKFDESVLGPDGKPVPVYTFEKELVDQKISISNGTGQFRLPGSLAESYMNINLPVKYDELGLMSMAANFSNSVMYFDLLTKDEDKLNFVDAKYKVSTLPIKGQELIIDPDGQERYVDSPSELSSLLNNIVNGIAIYGDTLINTKTDPSNLAEKDYFITAEKILYGNDGDDWTGLSNMKIVKNGNGDVDYYADIPLDDAHVVDGNVQDETAFVGVHFQSDASFNLTHVDFPAYHPEDPHAPKSNIDNMFQFRALGSRIKFALHADLSGKNVKPVEKSEAEQKEYKELYNVCEMLLGAYHIFKAPCLALGGKINITHAINGPMYNNINVADEGEPKEYVNLGTNDPSLEKYESLYIDLYGASDHSNKPKNHNSNVSYQQFAKLDIGTYDITTKNGNNSFVRKDPKPQHRFKYLWKQKLQNNYFSYEKLNDGQSEEGTAKVKLGFIEFSEKVAQLKEILVPIIDKFGGFSGESSQLEKSRSEIFGMLAGLKDKGIGRTVYKICDDFIQYRDDSSLNSIKNKGTFEGSLNAIESITCGNDGSLKIKINLRGLIEGTDEDSLSGIITVTVKTNGDKNDTYEINIDDVKFGGFYIDDSNIVVTRCQESHEEYEEKYITPYIDTEEQLKKYTELRNVNLLWDYFMNLYDNRKVCLKLSGSVMEDKKDSKGNLLNTNAGIVLTNQLSFDGVEDKFANKTVLTRAIPKIANNKRTGIYFQQYELFADGMKKTKDYINENGEKVIINGKPFQVIDKDKSNVFIHEQSYPVYKDSNGEYKFDEARNKNRPHEDKIGINAFLSIVNGEELIELVKCIPSLSGDYNDHRYSNVLKLLNTQSKIQQVANTFMNGVIDENKLNSLVRAKILTDFNLNANDERGVLTMKFNKEMFNFMPDTIEFSEDIAIIIDYHSEKKIIKDADKKMVFDQVKISTRLGKYDPSKHNHLPANGKTQFDSPKVDFKITFLDYAKNTVEDRFYYNENSKEEPKNYGHNINKPFTNMQTVVDLVRYAINDSVVGTGLKVGRNPYKKWELLGKEHGSEIAPSTYHIKLGFQNLNVPIFGDMKSMFNLEFFIYVKDDKVRMMMYLKLPCVGEPLKGSTTFNFTYRHFNTQTKAKDYYYNSVCVFEDGFNDEEKENGGIAYLYRYTSWNDDEHGSLFWKYNNNGFFDYRKVKGNDFKENLVEWVAYYMANLYNYQDYGKSLLGKTNDEDGQNCWYPEDILSNFVENKSTQTVSMKVNLKDLLKDKPIKKETVFDIVLHHKKEYLTQLDIKGDLLIDISLLETFNANKIGINGNVRVDNLTNGQYSSCLNNGLFMGGKYQEIVNVVGNKCGYTDVPYTERMWKSDAYSDYAARRDAKYKTTSGKWTSTGSWHSKPITW